MNIAIDGPSGVGKSTIAKQLANDLNISYLDTGAMYRGVGYFVIERGIKPEDVKGVLSVLDDINMDVINRNGQKIIINSKDVTPYIRENNISMAASTVSKIPEVRIKLVELQRKIAQKNDCVLDGRDICSYVLPNAEFKFFMTASSEIRAERRFKELKEKGSNLSYEEILKDIEARDLQDTTRAFAPLKATSDSIIVDTSNMSIDDVISVFKGYICK